MVRTVLSAYAAGNRNEAKKVRRLLKRPELQDDANAEQCVRDCKNYEECEALCKERLTNLFTITANESTEWLEWAGVLQDHFSNLAAKVVKGREALQQSLKKIAAQKAKQSRSETNKLKPAFAPYMGGGMSRPMCSWLVSCGLINPENTEKVGDSYKEQLLKVEDVAVRCKGDALKPWTYMVRSDSWSAITTNLKGERVTAAKNKLFEVLSQEKNPHDYLTIRIKAGDGDAYDSFSWVPQELRNQACTPEAVRDWAAPNMCMSIAGVVRATPESNAFPGIGQALVCVLGECLVMAWSIDWAVQLDISPADVFAYLSSLSLPQFKRWVDEKTFHLVLKEGSSCWIPYGFSSMILALSHSTSGCAVIQQPFINNRLAERMSPSVLSWVAKANLQRREHLLSKDSVASWADVTKRVCEWLAGLSAAGQEPQEANPLLCLENGEA